MPGPFTHAYAARRVADFLDAQGGFVRPRDGPLEPNQPLAPAAEAARFAAAMKKWPKYANLGAMGPDLFFFCMDFHQDWVPSDDIMLALRAVYAVDDSKRQDWEPFLAILEKHDQTFARVLRFLIKLDKAWQAFMLVWNDTIGKVTNAIGEFIDDMTGGMLTALGDAFTQFVDEIVAIFAEELLTSGDVFSFFSLVMQEGVDEQAFVWSDMLHYRKTSQMALNLLKLAPAMTDPDQRDQFLAYVMGFICHLGVDTTGHAFVNEQSGGPFRTHWQRHHLIENHIDAWMYRETKPGGSIPPDPFIGATDAFPSLAQSALYFAFQLKPDAPNGDNRPAVLPPEGKTPAEKRVRKDALDTDGELPLWLATAIVKALIDTYYDPKNPHECPANLQGSDYQRTVVDPNWQPPDPPLGFDVPLGFPLPWEVQVTYRFMLSLMKRAFMDGFDLPTPRPKIAPFPSFDTSDLAPDFSGVNPTDPPAKQLEEVILALLFWLKKLFEHAAQWAYDAAKSIASTATYPAREAIYENITLPAWQGVRAIREVLVHVAFLTPQDEERRADGELMHGSEIDEQLIQLGHTVDGAFRQALADATDPLGNLDKDPALITDNLRNPADIHFPFLPVDQEFCRPWAYPDKNNDESANTIEQHRTTSGPYPMNTLPDVLVRTDGPASNPLRLAYERAPTPHDTDCLNEQSVGHDGQLPAPLGGPVLFSSYLIGRIAAAAREGGPADFNLDSDRGYGYQCWGWDRRAGDTRSGYRGRKFDAPCAWPEAAHASGSDPPATNADRKWAGPATVLRLHYKRQPDPGCEAPNLSPDDCVPPIG